jgi:hypothetical protein
LRHTSDLTAKVAIREQVEAFKAGTFQALLCS